MPGVRFGRFLALTAIVVLLAAGAAVAQPVGGGIETAPPVAADGNAGSTDHHMAGQAATKEPGADGISPAAAAKPDEPPVPPAAAATDAVAKPDAEKSQEATSQPSVAPAAAAKPEEAATQSSAGSATPAAAQPKEAAQPAAPGKADETTAQPSAAGTAAPAAPAKPAEASDQPAGSTPAAAAAPTTTPTGEDSKEPPAAAAAPAATPAPGQPNETPTAPAAAAQAPATKPEPAATAGEQGPPATTTPAAPAASAVADANAAIAEQLRDLANGKFDRVIANRKQRTIIDAFYSGRDYAPIWITDGKPNARAKAAIDYLGHVDADGLDPADYPVPDFAALSDPAALAEAEIRLSESVITYAHHAEIGRVHWSRVSGDIYYDRKPPDPADVLANMAEAKDVGEALDAYEPHAPRYLALKAKLAQLRAGKADADKAPIANGPAPKIGGHDPRVAQLRERLGVPGDDTTYDKALAQAVKRFQQEHELRPTGTLTAATIEALNGRRPDRPIEVVIANMERWRWMPHDLGKSYVIVNLPDFTLRVYQDGKQVWMTKIVDGKPAMPTPIMTADMKYITVNPTWNVPPSIVAKEYLPALEQDPTVLERAGLQVSHNPDGTIHISQPPGDKNALGRLRFNFPNKFLVYQHDTPDKYLFAYDRRAYSHGCMRVQDPVKYAEVLLSIVRPGQGYTEDRIRRMFGSSETDIQFPTFIPVHLTYQTAFVDDAGNLEFRDDVYGRDKTLLAILNGSERKVADIPIERRENTIRREALAMPGWGGWGGGWSGDNFFARLFGGPYYGAQPTSARRRPVAQRRTEAFNPFWSR